MLQAKSPLNLSSGLAFSESAELFDELGPVFLKTRSQMATGERKQEQGREKIADSEEVKPRTKVFKKFSVSKWLKTQVLLDASEMKACLQELSPVEFYNVSSIALIDQLSISQEMFLQSYENYVSALKNGKVPEIDRKIFSSVATVDPEALYAEEVQPGRWMAKLAKPVVQLQHHRFFASKMDHKIHPMVMSPESIYWGLQFAFPQIFFDGSGGTYTKTSDETKFPNSALFAKLLKWLRTFSVPTTFILDGQKISSPIRLGKECFAWIANHPQLKEQGIKVHVY